MSTLSSCALLLAASFAILGCGDEFSSGAGGAGGAGGAQPTGGAAGSSVTTSTTGVGGSGGSGTSTTGGGLDGGGGAGPVAGKVECPDAPCSADQQCCLETIGMVLRCTNVDDTCAGQVIECDEDGDCLEGTICCFNGARATCRAAVECSATHLACTEDSDCSGNLCCFSMGAVPKCLEECGPDDAPSCGTQADCGPTASNCCPFFGGLYRLCFALPCADVSAP